MNQLTFWTCRTTLKRARNNTLRCLIGCSAGDLGSLFAMQHYGVDWSNGTVMAVSMGCGLATSFGLETAILRYKEGMTLSRSVETAFSMSLISMLSMEAAENATNYYLTGGEFDPSQGWWWVALTCSVSAGFITPFPYNYYMLKKYGKSCH